MKIRIGAGSGCSSDRIEPAVDLVSRGHLDYLVFECLAERSMAISALSKEKDADLGYNSMLKERMEAVLDIAVNNHTKIITNMGASNPTSAAEVVREVALKKGLSQLKIGVLEGDQVTDLARESYQFESSDNLISANAYLGIEGVIDLLKKGCDVIITGRIADASLFVAPVIYEFDQEVRSDFGAQATLMGHLLECCGQVTGGFYADPNYKDVPEPWNLGFPIATFEGDGSFVLSKLPQTGGLVTAATVKEQLVYEIFDLAEYITPDIIVDFSQVKIDDLGKDQVQLSNAKYVGVPDNYKVSLNLRAGYAGVGEISFAGQTSLDRAKLCEQILRERIKIINATYKSLTFSYIGYSSIMPDEESQADSCNEIRLRMFVTTDTRAEAEFIVREFNFFYTNGPSGSCAIETNIREQLAVKSMFVDKGRVPISTKVVDVK